jgi:hypothetical protein
MRHNDRACRVCKSPSRQNPCWWWLNERRPSFGKPAPCEVEDQLEFDRRERAAWARARRIEFIALAFMAAGAFVGLCVFWRYWT